MVNLKYSNIMKIINLMSIALVALVTTSCTGQKNQDYENYGTDELVVVNAEQFKAMQMAIGNPFKVRFDSSITVQGVIEPSPNAKAYITSPISGTIKSVRVTPSTFVKIGQPIIAIEGPEVMNAQTSFVETYNQYLVAKSNYERLKQLVQSGISSQKELLQVEGEFRILDAKLHAHKILLERIGLNPDVILKAGFSGEAYLVSPIQGVVSRIDAAIGKPVITYQPVAEVIDNQRFLLKFYLFLNQVNLVKPSQPVEIVLPGNGVIVHGKVVSVGLDANTENKAVECYASISKASNTPLISGMRVTAKVNTNFIDGWALPGSAVQEMDNNYFVYALEKSDSINYYFKKVPLQIGLTQDTIVQIFDSTLTNILLKGGYELNVEE